MSNGNINDPINLSGMGVLINKNGTKKGFDPSDLEEEIINGAPFQSKKMDLSEEFAKEIDELAENYGRSSAPKMRRSTPISNMRTSNTRSSNMRTSNSRTSNARTSKTGDHSIDDILKSLDALDDPSCATTDEEDNLENLDNIVDNAFNTSNFEPSRSEIRDPQLGYMTNEARKQSIIGNVLQGIPQSTSAATFNIDQEKEEEDKARALEQISFLLSSIEEEGDDISRIPKVNHTNTLSEILNVLRMLTYKVDRKRCCTFAEESILLGAHGLEWVFDGKKKYFGMKPDLVDWHKSVAIKLRRMRHDTSNVVSNIMQTYGLGSGTRLFLELIPSLVLYSRMRRSQHKDNIITDDEFNDSMNRIRDYE